MRAAADAGGRDRAHGHPETERCPAVDALSPSRTTRASVDRARTHPPRTIRASMPTSWAPSGPPPPPRTKADAHSGAPSAAARGRVDLEHAGEPGELEHLETLRPVATSTRSPSRRPRALEPADQHAEAGRVDEVDALEVDDHAPPGVLVDRLDQRAAQARERRRGRARRARRRPGRPRRLVARRAGPCQPVLRNSARLRASTVVAAAASDALALVEGVRGVEHPQPASAPLLRGHA